MPLPELVRVIVRPEHIYSFVLKRWKVLDLLPRYVHRKHLPRDRHAVLQTGEPDRVLGHAEVSRDDLDQVEGREFALLDQHVDVLTRARGLIKRHLIDEEVLGPQSDGATHARNICGQVA